MLEYCWHLLSSVQSSVFGTLNNQALVYVHLQNVGKLILYAANALILSTKQFQGKHEAWEPCSARLRQLLLQSLENHEEKCFLFNTTFFCPLTANLGESAACSSKCSSSQKQTANVFQGEKETRLLKPVFVSCECFTHGLRFGNKEHSFSSMQS